MIPYPKISIVTASFNQVVYLSKCIESVLSQQYPNLEYIIIDGGSTDGSVDVIRKYEKELKFWVAEPDGGLYHALNKGFSHATGEVMGWLNSDDILHIGSLFTIAEIFSTYNQVHWLQGYPTIVDELGRIVFHRAPRSSLQSFLQKEYHDGIFIQQESTYWRRDLWVKAGGFLSTDYKYAGDFELWMRFFMHSKLYTTLALIGAFRVRSSGQMSAVNYSSYLKESDSVIDTLLDQLEAGAKRKVKMLVRLKKLTKKFPFAGKVLNRFLVPEGKTKEIISFDFKKQQFSLAGV